MRLINRLLKDTSGNIAVFFAVAAVPMMLIASVAIDMSYAGRTNNNLQNALDRAALAAVANPNFTAQERKDFALKVFTENFVSKHKATVTYPLSGNTGIFKIKGEVVLPTTLGAIVKRENVAVNAESAAVLQEEGSICVLALAPDGPDRLYFEDRISFGSPNCAIHVNSSDVNAINNAGTGIPTAASFCAVGGGTGNFKPGLNSECAAIADPYAHLTFPVASEKCKGGKTQIKSNGKNGTEQATMTPGVYCKGLTVSGTNVDFAPGTYIIENGPLWFRKGSNATAYGVTFILLGKASLRIDHGASLFVRAPKSGDYAGLAFVQKPPADKTILPTGFSRLSSSGHLDIEGTLYFPTQTLEVNSESRFGSRSKATSFIAYEMKFTGDSVATVSTDYRAANLPPLEPRTTGGPRLVK